MQDTLTHSDAPEHVRKKEVFFLPSMFLTMLQRLLAT